MNERKIKRSEMVFVSICEYCRNKKTCNDSSYTGRPEKLPPVYECSGFQRRVNDDK